MFVAFCNSFIINDASTRLYAFKTLFEQEKVTNPYDLFAGSSSPNDTKYLCMNQSRGLNMCCSVLFSVEAAM
ncbi:uncharacterized protein CCR75_008732 [Bremia lactucae]|uniref:Uncharacterized protein n=1 Tax=Bremia lactucae TaxID=4779 RepID=A0A976FQ11_BRELC|nr:hypothetical protein CCR75_008732 [Bremia lactucae]